MLCLCAEGEGMNFCIICKLIPVLVQNDAVICGNTVFVYGQTIADGNMVFLCFFAEKRHGGAVFSVLAVGFGVQRKACQRHFGENNKIHLFFLCLCKQSAAKCHGLFLFFKAHINLS